MSPSSPLTFHGGRLDAAVERFPNARSPWIDLSTGINPRPFPTIAAGDADLHALPPPAALERLEAAAARAFGMVSSAIAAVPGSEIGLRLLATIGLPGPVMVATPCYRTHLDAFPDAVAVDVNDMVGAREAEGTALLANPGNPDGRLVAPGRLLDLARSMGRRGGWLLVDEAFADAVDGASILPLLGEHDPVLVLRSFGKFYGLAGVRLGFVCGHRTLVDVVRRRLGDWPVSATAIALGTAAYDDRRWADAARADLRRHAGRLDEVLAGHGLDASGACPLFRLIDSPRAELLFDHLGRAGILTRPFDYAPTWLRIGLPGNDEAFDRLAQALGDR